MRKLNPKDAPKGYRAVESEDCRGCAFDSNGACTLKKKPPFYCSAVCRKDRCNVIFVKIKKTKKVKDQLKDYPFCGSKSVLTAGRRQGNHMSNIEHRLQVLWTRTSEQLPPNSHLVLAYDGDDAFFGYRLDGTWYRRRDCAVVDQPAYWMHKPQIPPAGKETT
jgi:hypothetical protein